MKKLVLTVWTMGKKFLDEDDDSDFVLEEDEVREVLAAAWKTKTPRNFKRETTSRVQKTVKMSDDSRDAEISRGS